MQIKNKRGQSTVEYILLVTAVVAVMIAFSTSQNGALQTQLTNSMGTTVNQIGVVGNALDGSHDATGAISGGGTPPYTVDVTPS